MHHLLQENYYLRRRVEELERENQHIRLMLAAKTLVIDKIEFNFDKIRIDNLSGALQIGMTHSAEVNSNTTHLPSLSKGPVFRV
ncbi:spore germination protein GerPC [Tumebacillus sp. BK434]|uniref:spore germination protein GerPC n=1 Tax=Tumebacillus sp. BK434 TaxID=2512169 RepID=UPI0010DEEDDF|nr:spore germination protein GerPC [Tumebacillus sp. BK434]TCP54682.1 spore germination protein GerPC [Tumebacillus sp. BK434]